MDTIIISITDACPLKCIGCYATKDSPHMSLENFKKILDKLPLTESLTLTGGEPFIHPNLLEIVNYCVKTKREPRIVTSGYINHELLNKLKGKVELITVSLKYPNKSDELWKRRGGTFGKSVKFLEKANKLNIPLAINWVVDRQNWMYLYPMYRLASKYKAILEVVRFIPYKDEFRVFALKTDEWEKMCTHVKKLADAHISFPSKYSYQLCVGGVNRLYIRTDGSVTPCIYSTDVIGNIFKDSYINLERNGYDWRMIHKSDNKNIINGCIALLKEVEPGFRERKYKQMSFVGLGD